MDPKPIGFRFPKGSPRLFFILPLLFTKCVLFARLKPCKKCVYFMLNQLGKEASLALAEREKA